MKYETTSEYARRVHKARKAASAANEPILALLASMGVTCSIVGIGSEYNPWGGKKVTGSNNVYHATFKRGTKQFIVPKFYQSIAMSELNTPPTEYDILTCVQKYDVGSFANFCDEFGYDADSRNAMDTYLAVQAEVDGVTRFFTQAELEQISEIAQ